MPFTIFAKPIHSFAHCASLRTRNCEIRICSQFMESNHLPPFKQQFHSIPHSTSQCIQNSQSCFPRQILNSETLLGDQRSDSQVATFWVTVDGTCQDEISSTILYSIPITALQTSNLQLGTYCITGYPKPSKSDFQPIPEFYTIYH